MKHLDKIKARQRAIWSLGDYRRVAARMTPIAQEVCDAAQIAPGLRVLDVATATGNVAIEAATRGATVTGLDLTPRMLQIASARAEEKGLLVDWVEGDVEDMPFADRSFEVELSACGLWFAPRPNIAVEELRRTLQANGLLVIANFTPTSYMGQLNDICNQWLPLQNEVPEPNDWGNERVARSRLRHQFAVLECHIKSVGWSFPSAAAARTFLADHAPTYVAARIALDAASADQLFDEVERFTAHMAEPDGTVDIDIEYLLVVARKKAQ